MHSRITEGLVSSRFISPCPMYTVSGIYHYYTYYLRRWYIYYIPTSTCIFHLRIPIICQQHHWKVGCCCWRPSVGDFIIQQSHTTSVNSLFLSLSIHTYRKALLSSYENSTIRKRPRYIQVRVFLNIYMNALGTHCDS